jgi:hypothetical protein
VEGDGRAGGRVEMHASRAGGRPEGRTREDSQAGMGSGPPGFVVGPHGLAEREG